MLTSRLKGHTDHKIAIYSMRMHQNLPFFMEQNGKKWPLFGENLCFLASAKQLKTTPPLFSGCWMHVVWGQRWPKTIYSMLTT